MALTEYRELVIRGVHHVAVVTDDLDRMVGFYRDALGFEVVSRGGWPVGSAGVDRIVGLQGSSADTVMLRGANMYLEVFCYHTPPGRHHEGEASPADRGYTHFCLDVTDIDAEYERLSALGMTFHASPPGRDAAPSGALRSIYGRDPDGNIIELQEILDPSDPRVLEL